MIQAAVRLEPVLDLSIEFAAFPWSMIGLGHSASPRALGGVKREEMGEECIRISKRT